MSKIIRGFQPTKRPMAAIFFALVIVTTAFSISCSRRMGGVRPSGAAQGGAYTSAPALNKRILILPFINSTYERDESMGGRARTALAKALYRSGRFVILKNEELPKPVSQFMRPEGFDIPEIVKMARELGVVAVMSGSILDVRAKKTGDEVGLFRKVSVIMDATITVDVHSCSSGKKIYNTRRSARIESSTTKFAKSQGDDTASNLATDPILLNRAFDDAVSGVATPIMKAVGKLEWQGKVAMVSGSRIYVNAGRMTGLNIGDILRVLEMGDDVYDPETGVYIGKAPGRVKGTLEVVSYFGRDGAIAVVHSGAGFKENDIVELY